VDRGKQYLEGQVASQTLSVTLRKLENLGSLIDQLGEVSGIYLNSVMLDKEDKSIGLEEARQQAVQKALAKAELYAKGAQMQVGKPIKSVSTPQLPTPNQVEDGNGQ
jgi:uncharacterized protein YggE